MIEFLTSDLESLRSEASGPSCYWGPGGDDMVCDVMLDRLSNVAGLRDSWELSKDGFNCISWLHGEQCRAKGYLP